MKRVNGFLGLALLFGAHSVCYADNAKSEFSAFDLNENNTVSFNEFYIVMMGKNGEGIYQEFLRADENKNGLIAFNEADDFDATREEYQHADTDNSGQVDLHEFIRAMLRDVFDEADLDHNNEILFSEFKKVIN